MSVSLRGGGVGGNDVTVAVSCLSVSVTCVCVCVDVGKKERMILDGSKWTQTHHDCDGCVCLTYTPCP